MGLKNNRIHSFVASEWAACKHLFSKTAKKIEFFHGVTHYLQGPALWVFLYQLPMNCMELNSMKPNWIEYK